MANPVKIKASKAIAPVISKWTRPIIDIVLPSSAQRANGQAGWESVTFLDEPCCDLCGAPFEYEQFEKAVCAACIVSPPTYDQGRSALAYDNASRPMILSFKHGGRTYDLARFGRQLQRAGRRFFVDADFIVPVPLHRERLRKRRFNQSALLAKKLSANTGIPFEPDILMRHKATESQGAQTSKGRYRNVQGAFSIRDSGLSRLKDKSVILIDDVLTTGATLEACTRTLKRGGAKTVNVLTLARVVREQEIPT